MLLLLRQSLNFHLTILMPITITRWLHECPRYIRARRHCGRVFSWILPCWGRPALLISRPNIMFFSELGYLTPPAFLTSFKFPPGYSRPIPLWKVYTNGSTRRCSSGATSANDHSPPPPPTPCLALRSPRTVRHVGIRDDLQ